MSISKLSIKRPVGTVFLFLSVILFGIIALMRMDVDLFPKIEYPAITVITRLENKSPEQIRNLITIPLEEILSSTPGLRNMESVSRFGESIITLRFDWGIKMDMLYMATREKLDFAKSVLPQGTTRPVALRFDPNSEPVLVLGVEALRPDIMENSKTFVRKTLKPLLERISGVSFVQVVGGKEKVVYIKVNLEKLFANQLVIDDVVKVLKENNIEYPVGYIKENKSEFSIRIEGKIKDYRKIGKLVVGLNKQGVPIFLENIAKISEEAKEQKVLFQLNGKEGLAIRFFKEGDANIVKTSQAIKEALPGIMGKFSKDLKYSIVKDNSLDIASSISNIGWSAAIGMVLAFFVLFWFIREMRSSLIVGLAIPLSVIITVFFMYLLGITVNLISLSGLSIGIGMMVDANIVVIENIKRKERLGDLTLYHSVEEVQGPILSSILTNIAVFLPIVFIRGIASSIFKELALVVTFSLLSSLLTSISLTPALYKLFIANRRNKRQYEDEKTPHILKVMTKLYVRGLDFVINHASSFVIIMAGLTIISVLMSQVIPKQLLPKLSQSSFEIKYKFPVNNSLEKTKDSIVLAEKKLSNLKGVDYFYSIIGDPTILAGARERKKNYLAQTHVFLKQATRAGKVIAKINPFLALYLSDGRPVIHSQQTVFTKIFPEEKKIYIEGFPHTYLERTASVITNMLYRQGVSNVALSVEKGDILEFEFDRAALNKANLSIKTIAKTANIAFLGQKATEIETVSRLPENIIVLADKRYLRDIKDLSGLLVRTPAGITLPIENFVSIDKKKSINELHRRNQQDMIDVAFEGSGKQSAVIEKTVQNLKMNKNIHFEFSWDSPEIKKSIRSLLLALFLSVVVIFVIIAFQFESVVKPLIIMLSIPLVFIGIIPVFILTGISMNIISIVGAILLVGIVVNNAIILVDYFERNKKEVFNKESLISMIKEAASVRLRPILMTSLTTIISMIPLIFFPGRGLEFQRILAVTVVTGFIFSTSITLFFIPVVYYLVEKRRV